MNLVHRTALRIVTRLRAHQSLRLAVMLYRGAFRTFDLSTDSIDGLGRHYTLIGVFDHRITLDELNDELERAILQWRSEHR